MILSKIQDEYEKEDGDTYDFQSMTFAKDGDEEFETNEKLFDRINELYCHALKSKLYILDEKELGKYYVVEKVLPIKAQICRSKVRRIFFCGW